MQITLPQQVGCFRHRHMIQHIWSVQGQWSRGAVVCELSPPAFCHHAPRWKCHVGFLTDTQTAKTRKNRLDEVQEQELPPLQKWPPAELMIKKTTMDYHKRNTIRPPSSVLSLLLSSTRDQVCTQGWVYLQLQGLAPRTHCALYTMLVQCHEQAEDGRIGLERLGEIKGLIARQQMNEDNRHSWHKQIDRLMKNVKKAKHLSWLRNKTGHRFAGQNNTNTLAALGGYVPGTGRLRQGLPKIPGSTPHTGCSQTIGTFAFQAAIAGLGGRGPLEASPGASPGLHGFPLPIYSSFSAFFSPLMLNIIQSAQESGLFCGVSRRG